MARRGKRRKKTRDEVVPGRGFRRRRVLVATALFGLLAALAAIFVDARHVGLGRANRYVGSETCGSCHKLNHPAWRQTLHATMIQPATPSTVVGDFERDNEYWLRDGVYSAKLPGRDRLLVRMERHGSDYYARIHDPETGQLNPYRITHVVGTTYRQVYLVESKGIHFRVPIQWSIPQQRWVNLWNRQARADETLATPMAYFLNPNAHWNEFCARCHTTGYRAESGGRWAELGIACESCHGAGATHSAYFEDSLRLRLRSWILNVLDLEPNTFIVRPSRLEPAESVAVCGQCHQADIWMRNVARFVDYEPGEDLSAHFYEMPLDPNTQDPPSNKTWPDGSPRGPGLLFRSFVESRCFKEGGVTCIDCHDPHIAGAHQGLLEPGRRSDQLCNFCHPSIAADVAGHTHHDPQREGSRCYGCHLPRTMEGLTMVGDFDYARIRTHELDHIPYPESTVRFGGPAEMPNACDDCHADRDAGWAAEWSRKWWGSREGIAREIRQRFEMAGTTTREKAVGL